jgi:GT2 family glycosyltransferase
VGDCADVIEVGRNIGFGPGANVGLRHWLEATREPWAIVAPHDAEPVGDCVARLLGELEDRPTAAMASAEYGPGEDFKPTIDKFFGGSFVPTARGEGWEAVDYPHGTLLALRRDAMDQLGLFDERFFAYCEEADLGARAR